MTVRPPRMLQPTHTISEPLTAHCCQAGVLPGQPGGRFLQDPAAIHNMRNMCCAAARHAPQPDRLTTTSHTITMTLTAQCCQAGVLPGQPGGRFLQGPAAILQAPAQMLRAAAAALRRSCYGQHLTPAAHQTASQPAGAESVNTGGLGTTVCQTCCCDSKGPIATGAKWTSTRQCICCKTAGGSIARKAQSNCCRTAL
jgi:hypothetical protein